jgi:hypothetical protein
MVVVASMCALACSHPLDHSTAFIARLHHPLHGRPVCSDHAGHAVGIIGLYAEWRHATISVTIDDMSVATFESTGEDAETETSFLEFPLFPRDADVDRLALPLARSLRIAVFDEAGDDLQPEILSEFQIVQCPPLSDVNAARLSLTAEQVRSFARVLRSALRLISCIINVRRY